MARINLMPEGFKNRAGGKFIILLIVAYLLFGLVLISSAGFYFWQTLLQKNLNNLEKQIASLLPAQFNQQKINWVSQLLHNHIYWSQVLPRLEKTTLAKVYFSSFNGCGQTNTVSLTGNVANYSTLAKQVKAFEQEFGQVKFSSSGLSKDGGLNINIELHGIKLSKN